MRVDIVAKSENKSFAGAKTEVFVHLLQKVADSKDSVFGRTPQSAKNFIRESAFLRVKKEFCSVAAGNFAQSFMGKKSKLQIENLFSIHFSAREKVFTNCRIVQTIPEKFPVGSFR